MTVVGNVVGLPPVLVYQDAHKHLTIVTSSWVLLQKLTLCELRFSVESLTELCSFGYPSGHRTLFQNIVLLGGGRALELSDSGQITFHQAWQLLDRQVPELGLREYIDEQVRVFDQAIAQLDCTG
ncbi:MAG: hypothetical protein HY348_06500 [Nitrospira defluvii]|nr:hypothetical protein [Nitrospira defluvii]